MDKWDECGGVVDPYELEGRECYAGLDLSSTSDLTTLVLVFPPRDETEPYIVLPFFWLPEETLPLRVRRDHVMYDKWERQQFLKTTEGNVVHYGFIEQFMTSLGLLQTSETPLGTLATRSLIVTVTVATSYNS